MNSIRTRLFGAFGAVASLGVVGAGVGILGFGNMSGIVGEISDKHIPSLESSFMLSETSSEYNARINALAVAVTEEKRRAVFNEITELQDRLSNRVTEVSKGASEESQIFWDLRSYADAVPEVTAKLNGLVEQRIQHNGDVAAGFAQARRLRQNLTTSLESRIDEVDELTLETLLRVLMAANVVTVSYAEAIATSDPKTLERITSTYDGASSEMRSNIAILGADASAADKGNAKKLLEIGKGDNSLFDNRRKELDVIAAADGTAAEAVTAAQQLITTVTEIADATKAQVTAASENAKGNVVSGQTILIALTILSIAASVAILWLYVMQNLMRRLTSMSDVMRALADGDVNVSVDGVDQADEIGDMARSVQVFKDNATERKRLEEEQAKEQALRAKRAEAIELLIQNFDNAASDALKTVQASAGSMETAANAMGKTAEHTAHQTSAVAAASEQATANVETVAAASEELSSSIMEISRQVQQSADTAQEAVTQVNATNEDVDRLVTAADRIGDVVSLIDQIAHQTNLLALNATIEAARAGESGKGFAVVASEVKTLANQTSNATKTIVEQINDLRQASEGAVGAMRGIGDVITNMREVTTSIASAVEEQRAATEEISRNAQEVATGTREVSTKIVEVDSATTENGETARQVLGAASDLAHASNRLQGDVAEFLGEVRAA